MRPLVVLAALAASVHARDREGHPVRALALLPCARSGIFLPGTPASVAWGDGGYRDAVRQAQAQAPDGVLTDVRADLRVLSILTIWRRQCVVVTAAATP